MLPPPCPKRAAVPAAPCSSSEHHPVAPHGERLWASLPGDLVRLIGSRVLAGGDLWDYVQFRAVCSHWSSSTVRPRGRGILDPRFHPRRWMMLPEGHGLYPGHPRLGGYVRFFSLSTGAFVRVHLPHLDDHAVLESVDGLLLLYRRHDSAIRLLHPFTGDIAELPPLLSLLPQMDLLVNLYHYHRDMDQDSKLRFFRSGFCAAVTVSASGAITVMLALDSIDRVAYATTGDQRWTFSSWALPVSAAKPVAFQGKLHMASTNWDWEDAEQELPLLYIYRIDLPRPDEEGSHTVSLPPPEMIALWPSGYDVLHYYMVECGSDLMLVECRSGYEPLVVYRLADLISGRVVPLTSIGEQALILGEHERGMCLSPSKGLPTISGNSIICETSAQITYGDPLVKGYCSAYHRRVEQYDLACGTWSLVIDNSELHSIPAGPCSLIHHIFACCNRRYWKKEFRMENVFSDYSYY